MDNEPAVGILGATSLVGECLLPLLTRESWRVLAYSRQSGNHLSPHVEWRQLDSAIHQTIPGQKTRIKFWICAAPIWVLPDYFELMSAHKVERVVAISSTSLLGKSESKAPAEQAVVQCLINGEAQLREWAGINGIAWRILRPTMIYGRGRDKNITEIARLIRRFGFFPLIGTAGGLRQPVHAEDVAAVCISALKSGKAANRVYNISGGEILRYSEMVRRIFTAMHRQPRLIKIPLKLFSFILICLHLLPRYRHWTLEMAERMDRDLVFEHSDAGHDLGFSPRPFQLTQEDMAQ